MGSPSDKTSCGSFRLPSDASPDSECPICLNRIQNRALTNSCSHSFCFLCILEWAKRKAECPLCQQTFDGIIHSVKSDTNYKEYELTTGNDSSLSSPEGRRFRYRSTMTRERWRWQHESGSFDGGVLFDGASRQQSLHNDVEIEQMTQQLRERRRARLKNRHHLRRLQEQEMIAFRCALYRKCLWVKRVEDGGRYREVSAELFRQNPACLHRLVPWLKRELTVLFGECMCVINIVKDRIMSTISLYDLDRETFRQDLKPFIVHRTDHFLHELRSFAQSPFNIDAYDERACYTDSDSHDGGYVDNVISSSTDDSVIPLSPDFEPVLRRDLLPDELSPSLSGWDDVTPGPSYVSPSCPHDLSTSRVSSTGSGLPKEECRIVGCVKPRCVETDSKADGDDMEECRIVRCLKPRCVETDSKADGDDMEECRIVGCVKPRCVETDSKADGDDMEECRIVGCVKPRCVETDSKADGDDMEECRIVGCVKPRCVETDSKADGDDMEECLIVGFVKPRCERTPELVTFSSDSESEQPGPS
uniref:E3 ubiquitin-protein ligase Topors-like n=1 Tax=Myxine glutinosa TaxID=7769 RepID=UPI00358EF2E5